MVMQMPYQFMKTKRQNKKKKAIFETKSEKKKKKNGITVNL